MSIAANSSGTSAALAACLALPAYRVRQRVLTGRAGLTARLVLVSIVWQKLPKVTNSRSPSLVLRAPCEDAHGRIMKPVHTLLVDNS